MQIFKALLQCRSLLWNLFALYALCFASCATFPSRLPEQGTSPASEPKLLSRPQNIRYYLQPITWIDEDIVRQVAPSPVTLGKGFVWPLKNVFITSCYGVRKKKFHEGVDLRAKVGTPVYAAQDGVVVTAHPRVKGYGKLLVLQHHQSILTVYGHLSRFVVKNGQKVKKGDLVAYTGNTGRSSAPHLHFEIRKEKNSLDPIVFLADSKSYLTAHEATPSKAKPAYKKRLSKG